MNDTLTKDEGVALNQGPRRDDGVGSNPDLRAQGRQEPRCRKHNVPMDIETDCRVCRGDGMVEDDEGGVTDWVRCWSCRGSGRGLDDCEYCLQEDEDDI